jgi:hypothetical protein
MRGAQYGPDSYRTLSVLSGFAGCLGDHKARRQAACSIRAWQQHPGLIPCPHAGFLPSCRVSMDRMQPGLPASMELCSMINAWHPHCRPALDSVAGLHRLHE